MPGQRVKRRLFESYQPLDVFFDNPNPHRQVTSLPKRSKLVSDDTDDRIEFEEEEDNIINEEPQQQQRRESTNDFTNESIDLDSESLSSSTRLSDPKPEPFFEFYDKITYFSDLIENPAKRFVMVGWKQDAKTLPARRVGKFIDFFGMEPFDKFKSLEHFDESLRTFIFESFKNDMCKPWELSSEYEWTHASRQDLVNANAIRMNWLSQAVNHEFIKSTMKTTNIRIIRAMIAMPVPFQVLPGDAALCRLRVWADIHVMHTLEKEEIHHVYAEDLFDSSEAFCNLLGLEVDKEEEGEEEEMLDNNDDDTTFFNEL